jgi:hypothetical protein
MIGQLLTLPLRIGARGTQLVLRTAEGVVGRAAMSALQIVGAVKRGDTSSGHENGNAPASASSGSATVSEPSPTVSQPSPSRETSAPGTPSRSRGTTPAPERTTPIVSAPQPQDVEQPLAPEPVHVSEEAELVREEAEPGAEDGAGAAVRVQPPWEGYERMAAREVIARLGDASAAELAAVELYERNHRSRQTVLEAAERRLKAANGRG